MTPEISVIIPVHNRCAMLRDAAASVTAQREANLELIIVDDGSTDGTHADMAAMLAGLVTDGSGPNAVSARLITMAHRRGPAAARNIGAAVARGDLVAFLDSDDLWMPEKLARQLAFMRSHPELKISQCNELWIRNGRRVNPGRRHLKRGGDFFVDSLATCLVSPSAVIIKRDFFRAMGGFDEEMAACEDYDLWLRILAQSEIGLTDETLVIRRAGHPDQLSANIPALDRFRIVAMLKVLADFELGPVRRAAVCAEMSRRCEILAGGFARRGNIEAASLTEEIGRLANGRWKNENAAGIAPILVEARSRLLGAMGHEMTPVSMGRVDA